MISTFLAAVVAVAQVALPTAESPHLVADSLPPISTDRPTVSASPGVVPRGSLQIETGWTFSRATPDGIRTDVQTLPEALLRLGVSTRLEVRLTSTGWRFDSSSGLEGSSRNGFTDLYVGAKASLWDEGGARPAISLLADLNVPIADSDFAARYVNPQLWLLFANTLSDRLGITYNVGSQVSSVEGEDGRKTTDVDLIYAVSVAGEVAPTASLFAEAYGSAPLSGGDPATLTVQSGGVVLLTRRIQIDGRIAAGLTNNTIDWLAGLGFSIRIFR